MLADSTNNELFTLPMGKLVDHIYGDSKHTTLLPGNIVASSPTQPLPMSLLDSLTVHAKMRLEQLLLIINKLNDTCLCTF